MNRMLSTLPERALQLAGQLGDGIRGAVPAKAIGWVETGAALGALKTGTRVARKFVRRNPVITIAAAAAGAGLLLYAARRRAMKSENGGVIEGRSKRIEAKRATPADDASAGARRARKTTARKATATKTASRRAARKPAES